MYATILVPLDGSPRAEGILAHVERLAGCFSARLILLQVVEPSIFPPDTQNYFQDLDAQRMQEREEQAASYLSGLVARLDEMGIQAQCRIEYGPVVETIIQVAEEEQAELIAMASHGRSGLGQVIYGSVAQGVLHQVDRPLFLIRSIDKK